jgi:cadmium resistance protein CadD (predicted permease)
MLNLLTILAVLFAVLFLIVTLLERFGRRHSSEDLGKWSRWIIPLIALVFVLQALRYFFMN